MKKTLANILEDELKDLYSAENQLVVALPKLAKHAQNEKLKDGFSSHLEQTKKHVERLEEAAKILDISPKGKACHGMMGLIDEGAELLKEDASAATDAALIGAAQRVEHYEIAGYGALLAHAKLLGEGEIVELLTRTLEEEVATDTKLTEIAEGQVNMDAVVSI